jgi:MoxR-like ATPase
LRRRCLYHYVEYPQFDKELLIVETRLPEAPAELARQLVEFVQSLRQLDLQRKPGIAETLDWAAALLRLNVGTLEAVSPEAILDSLAALLKTRSDRASMTVDVVQRMVAAC